MIRYEIQLPRFEMTTMGNMHQRDGLIPDNICGGIRKIYSRQCHRGKPRQRFSSGPYEVEMEVSFACPFSMEIIIYNACVQINVGRGKLLELADEAFH